MISFFKKKAQVSDIGWLGIDIHSHLLPGIDDGSPDLDKSLNLIRQLNELGFYKFLCTPHIFTELYPNNSDTITSALTDVKNAMNSSDFNVEIGAAAEYMVDETFKITDDLLCLPGKHILIEMSYLSETPNIEDVIFKLQLSGYKVILAHPERYNFNHKSLERYHRYKDLGVMLQLNLLSVYGYYGKDVKVAADYLLEQEMYDLAATDLHHDKHLKTLTSAVTSGYLYNKLGNYNFKNKELFS